MTDRKTLQLRSPDETAEAAPVIKKKGRGWEISDKRLDARHDRARDMRRHASPAHKALAERFAKADLGGGALEPVGGIGLERNRDRFHRFAHPTLPSSEIASSFCASTANSIGNCFITSLAKPLTISATASSCPSPRCIA